MKEELDELLLISNEDIDGIIKDLPNEIPLPKRIDMQFHYIQLQDGRTRTSDFLSLLESSIIAYCLKREDVRKVNYKNAALRIKEAKEMLVRGEHSGEMGELALYMLLEGKMEAPQILSKMSLKTSGNLNFNGTDAVHMKITDEGKILLFLGESKIYKNLKGSIDSCIKSIEDFYFDELVDGRTQFDFELRLISNNLDIDDPTLKEQIKKLLNPYEGGKEQLRYINACFIAFEWNLLNELQDIDSEEYESELVSLYQEKTKEIVSRITDLIQRKNQVCKLRFHFFFIPFPDVEEAKQQFRKNLGFKG